MLPDPPSSASHVCGNTWPPRTHPCQAQTPVIFTWMHCSAMQSTGQLRLCTYRTPRVQVHPEEGRWSVSYATARAAKKARSSAVSASVDSVGGSKEGATERDGRPVSQP